MGKLERSDDVDWFSLSHDATEPWLLEVIVEPKAAGLDLAIELEIEGQSSGALYNLGGPDAQESIPVLAIEQAAVRLAIRARAGSGDYAVRFKRRLTGGSIEAEPNDVASQAWPFSAPGEIQGVYDRPGDRDVFAVKLPELAPVIAKEGQLPDDARGVYTVQVSGIDGSPQVVELMTSPDQRVPWATLYVPAGAAAELPNVRPPEGVTMIWAALSGGKGATREQAYRLKWLPYPPLPKGQRFDVVIMEGALARLAELDALDYDEQLGALIDYLEPTCSRLVAVSAVGEGAQVVTALQEASMGVMVHEGLLPVLAAQGIQPMSVGSLSQCRGVLSAGGCVIAAGGQLDLESPAHQLLESLAFVGGASSPKIALLNAIAPGSIAARELNAGRAQRFSLPNHAPPWALRRTVEVLDPKLLVLVHAERKALQGLKAQLRAQGYKGSIKIPRNGDILPLGKMLSI